MNSNELFEDNLRDSHWLGQVVDIKDPLNQGRCRVRVFGKFDLIETEFIPWASPINRGSVGSHLVPNIGDIVGVRFNNGNIYQPEYSHQIKQNEDLKSEVLDGSSAPENVISLVYDAKRNLRIYYSPEDGLVMTSADSKNGKPMIRLSAEGKIFINADDIFIASNSNDESQPAVKGQKLVEILEDLITEVRNHVHPTNNAPMLPTSIMKLASIQKKVKSIKQTKNP